MKNSNSYYMADFAASDRRSVKAHLAGTSYRAMAYIAFATLAACVGRGESAPEDYLAISRYLFRRRDKFRASRDALVHVTTAVVGLVAGGILHRLF